MHHGMLFVKDDAVARSPVTVTISIRAVPKFCTWRLSD